MNRSHSSTEQVPMYECFLNHVNDIASHVGLPTPTAASTSNGQTASDVDSESDVMLDLQATVAQCTCTSCLTQDTIEPSPISIPTQETQSTSSPEMTTSTIVPETNGHLTGTSHSLNSHPHVSCTSLRGLIPPVYTRDARRHNYDFTYHVS